MSRADMTGATDIASYPYWVDEHVRFADLDMQGHVTNVAFTVYAESGRAAFLREVGLWVPGAPRYNVVAKLEANYLHEILYPGEVRVGLRVLRIGDRSFTLGIGLFNEDRCAGVIETVHVRMTAATRSAVSLNEDERACLRPWQGKA